MNNISFYILILVLGFSKNLQAQIVNPKLDTALAKSYDADEYGMKKYVFVALKSGSNKGAEKSFVDSCFKGHLENIRRLAAQKQLIIAGPFMKNDADLRGLFILNVKTLEEANKLLETDPAIKANLLKAELYSWYGSAALPAYLEVHDKIWKNQP